MEDGPSFDEVLSAARAGDGAAFEVLYRSLSGRVQAFVAARGGHDPDGMVNDVFLKVFTNIGGFTGNETQFQAWVFRITRNTLIDDVRRRRRRVDETGLDHLHETAAPGRNVEDEAMGHVGTSWALQQLDFLTPEQREVLLLRLVADLTIESIADVLGKRVGAVKATQRRALRTLARNLPDETVPPGPPTTL